jgi:hypothetical protein
VILIISTGFWGWLNLGKTYFFNRAEPLAQTLEMIKLSQAKGSKLRND